MSEKSKWSISSAGLHIIAMTLMLCDHLWGTLFPAQEWLTCIGRISFPIFAFMIAEGYRHTKNLKKYMLRIFISAVIAEIPFDLMIGETVFYPYHQNVLWTFLISLIIINLIEKFDSYFSPIAAEVAAVMLMIIGFFTGYVVMVDYYGVGILTVLLFYYFHKRNWKNRLAHIIFMYILNVGMLGGYYYEVQIFGHPFEIVQQGFAIFALIPIWLYQGKQGVHRKLFQYFCYAFYPMHIIILVLIRAWILR